MSTIPNQDHQLQPPGETVASRGRWLRWSGFAALAGAACCLAAFRLIGSSVDAQGVLQEPFALLPLGFLLACMGAVALLVDAVRQALRRRARST